MFLEFVCCDCVSRWGEEGRRRGAFYKGRVCDARKIERECMEGTWYSGFNTGFNRGGWQWKVSLYVYKRVFGDDCEIRVSRSSVFQCRIVVQSPFLLFIVIPLIHMGVLLCALYFLQMSFSCDPKSL